MKMIELTIAQDGRRGDEQAKRMVFNVDQIVAFGPHGSDPKKRVIVTAESGEDAFWAVEETTITIGAKIHDAVEQDRLGQIEVLTEALRRAKVT